MARSEYDARRDPARTPEPFGPVEPVDHTDRPGAGASPGQGRNDGRGDTFVVQEHHASALHWDVRLERDGVLVSWAVPKGLPLDPHTNHLAKHTEDHPASYATFAGEIPAGEYGGGRVRVWDSGTYSLETWTDREVKVVLAGGRVSGRYVFFRTGKTQDSPDWMVHRMDPSPPGWQPLPAGLTPMLATTARLPGPGDGPWSYELKWDGVRALATVDGGRLRLASRSGRDVTVAYPELRAFAEELGSTQVLLDGEVVALGPEGRPDFGLLQSRMHVSSAAQARRLSARTPVSYLVFDLLHLDGQPLLEEPYERRRALLEGLPLAAPAQVPPSFPADGAAVLAASRAQGLEGVVAKRRDSRYEPGRRSECWVKVKNVARQEVVVAGWEPGEGSRAGRLGALLVGVQTPDGLTYAGQVGTGFTDATLRSLQQRLDGLRRDTAPLVGPLARADVRDAVWVEPVLVAEVEFTAWTRDGRLRHPSFKGLREDVDPAGVVREPTPEQAPTPAPPRARGRR